MNEILTKANATLDDVYATSAFKLLAQGMKDRQALEITISLLTSGLPGTFENFERWATEMLDEQEKE